MEYMPLYLFATVFIVLLLGYPVAFSLAGTALIFSVIGELTGTFDSAFLEALPNRLYGIIGNQILIAVPLFVFMGVMLERSKIADDLLITMSRLFGKKRGGLGISVVLVGMLLAASTGIVGATVVTMGLLSLPTMLKQGYDPKISTGLICASGTLGQIIPPSIVLVLLGDVLSNAYQQAQLEMGVFSPETISVGDLFIGALIPGLILVSLYILYIITVAIFNKDAMPATDYSNTENATALDSPLLNDVIKSLMPPLLLIVSVLGSIIAGLATPTEAAAIGAVGAMLLAATKGMLKLDTLQQVVRSTTRISCMVFMILIGAALFSLVFRGFEGDELIQSLLGDLEGGKYHALFIVMLVMFLLGFVLDFIEITFVIVPIVGPILLAMGIDPVWLGILIAINLQTSFLTPPFGFALFYLRGVAPAEIRTTQIYQGVMPFIVIQLITMAMIAYWPMLATWLPMQIS